MRLCFFGARAMGVTKFASKGSQKFNDLLTAAEELLESLLRVVIRCEAKNLGKPTVKNR